ncbi:MAG: DUF6279 family lipoprotein [Chromatiaceae bacterium]|nr:DUF6279 family lipoprotein [Chromatiaceae bacterium]
MRPILIAILLSLLTAGCSSVQLAYNSADFFIERYADDYLGLDGAQMQHWSPVLETALERHRAEELPYLASFFAQAAQDAHQGFTRAKIDCLFDQFETIYQRHFRLASATAAPLLAGLSAQQIDRLAETFAEEDKDDAAKAGAEEAARRARKRAERYVDQMRWWFGDLSSAQRGLVADVARRIPDTAPAWYAYRAAKRNALIELLRGGASQASIEQFMIDWLVDYRDLPSTLATAQPALPNAFADLLLRLQPTLSDAQRERFIGRLEGLERDFMRLQKTPRLAPLPCGSGYNATEAHALEPRPSA